jgi:hypothetical protein
MLEHVPRLVIALPCGMRIRLAAAQNIFIGSEIAGGRAEGELPLEAGELYRRGADDASGDVLLHPENVLDLGVVTLGPDVPARRRFGQLGRNTNPIAGAADAAVEQVAHVQPAPDLGRRQLLSFEREAR